MSGDLSTLRVIHPDRDDGPAHMRVHRIVYGVTTIALGMLLVLLVVDIRGPVFGVDSDVVTANTPDGVALRVQYPEVTRPALASPLSIEVSRADGFSAPLEIAISRPWIEAWDENGMYPSPSAETGDPDWVVYEFEPPDGNTFRFFYDARLEPARQESVSGAIELREDGVAVAAVEFKTVVRP